MSAAFMYRQMAIQETVPVASGLPTKKITTKKLKQKNRRLRQSSKSIQRAEIEKLAPNCSANMTEDSIAAAEQTTDQAISSAVKTSESREMQWLVEHNPRDDHVTNSLTNGVAPPSPPTNGTALPSPTNGAAPPSPSTTENAASPPRDSSALLVCNYGSSTGPAAAAATPERATEVKALVESRILLCSNSCPTSTTSCSSSVLCASVTEPTPLFRGEKRKLQRTSDAPSDERKVKKKKKKQNKKTGNDVRLKHSISIVDQIVDDMSSCRSADSLNAKEEAKQLFQWLIHPVKPDQFFKDLWEKKPLLIKRHNPKYNDGWFSSKDFSDILKNNPIQFGTHVDLTSYRDSTRQTHNKPGRAFPGLVWKHYKEGGSIRMLNPQTYSEPVWRLLNTLQDYFRSTMGANVYLTPPGTQGFAPHYDDIEAFLIQLEGKKHWRLYAPRTEEEELPIHSSGNFSQSELGKEILDTVLEAGDMLYFPRGTVHQGNCLPDTHSLHITVSTYQMNTWGDLLERLLPKALTIARAEDSEYRAGLPRDYLDYMGISKSDVDSPNRAPFINTVEKLLARLVKYAPVDSAADDLASRLLRDALPPNPNRSSVLGRPSSSADHWASAGRSQHSECSAGVTTCTPKITATSRVRLTTPYVGRLMVHEHCVSLQHSSSNSRLFHEITQQEIDYTVDYGPALEMLTNTYPIYLEVKALSLPTADSIQLVQELLDMGILQQKPGSGSRSTPSLIAAIKSRVSRPPPKIKSRGRKGSEEEIVIRMRNGSNSTKSKRAIRPSSEVFGQLNIEDSEFALRRNRTLEK